MPNRNSPDADGSGAASQTSHSSPTSYNSHSSHRVIPPRGDYRTLITYQKAEAIYDITFHFCRRFVKRGDRTADQMIQAARSGKQNIVEGSKAGTTSKESEIKLTNVARASLEELLQDYGDFLRVQRLPVWKKNRVRPCTRVSLGKKPRLHSRSFARSSKRATATWSRTLLFV